MNLSFHYDDKKLPTKIWENSLQSGVQNKPRQHMTPFRMLGNHQKQPCPVDSPVCKSATHKNKTCISAFYYLFKIC
jgi:hypothetical protein